jgi:hypothetical protein
MCGDLCIRIFYDLPKTWTIINIIIKKLTRIAKKAQFTTIKRMPLDPETAFFGPF